MNIPLYFSVGRKMCTRSCKSQGCGLCSLYDTWNNWLIDWLIDWLTDADWLIDWFQRSVYNCSDGLKHHNKNVFIRRPSKHNKIDVE